MEALLEFWRILLRPALEIGLIAFLIYEALYFLRDTRGSKVLAGLVIALMALSLAADYLNLMVIKYLLDGFWTILATAMLIIFQPELRRAFAQLGSLAFLQGKHKREIIGELVTAVVNMSRRRCGALIVIERRIGMRGLADDAVKLDIKVNSMILESIFYPNSPLHDGAVLIKNGRIIAARVILPLTCSDEFSKRLGTRHRAAVGITEETDAVVVLVSEETGTVSIACRGGLYRELDPASLEEYLEKLIIEENDESLIPVPVESLSTRSRTRRLSGPASSGTVPERGADSDSDSDLEAKHAKD